MIRRYAIVCGLILAFAAVSYCQTGTDAAGRCAALTKLQIPGVALEITKAEWHAAGKTPAQPGPMNMTSMELPAYCRIDGMLDRRM